MKALFLASVISLALITKTFGQFYFIVLYNAKNQSQVTTQRLKFKNTAEGDVYAGRYLRNKGLEQIYNFMVVGSFPSEEEAAKARELKKEVFTNNGFTVQDIKIDLYKTPNNPGLASRPLDISTTPPGSFSSNTSPAALGVSGYIKSMGSRIKVRVYSEKANGNKGVLLYENWIERDGYVKIMSEKGRIVYNYKSAEGDPYGGDVHTDCAGTLSQAISVP